MVEVPKNFGATVIARCRELAEITDVPGETTRLYLSPATADAHALLSGWMRQAGFETRMDDIGNLRAIRRAAVDDAPTLVLFSHIDTVPNAGAFDGPLGVIAGLAAMEALGDARLSFNIELIAFSEEEGVRFAFPFLSSLAVTGQLTDAMLEHTDTVLAPTDIDGKTEAVGVTLADAIRTFGLRPEGIPLTTPLGKNTFAAIEVHIEQGLLLESVDEQLAVVDTIAGQSRLKLTFEGRANHAGTTPMALRHDALVSAAEFIIAGERYAASTTNLVATVGRIEALPGAMNVVPGRVHLTLDVRHPQDDVRRKAVADLLVCAEAAGKSRGVSLEPTLLSEQQAVPMDAALTTQLRAAAARSGFNVRTMFSGAGHDAMILAPHVPTTMLFVRSPGGVSHSPAEAVREQDVDAALITLIDLLLHVCPPARL